MALFKCLRSGNVVNIDQQDDIDRMKFHEGYVAVGEVSTHSQGDSHEHNEMQSAFAQAPQVAEAEVKAKKRGRPSKVEVVGEL
jgi:cupin superfamily acireductone dioxygenase involved in methionine salvage